MFSTGVYTCKDRATNGTIQYKRRERGWLPTQQFDPNDNTQWIQYTVSVVSTTKIDLMQNWVTKIMLKTWIYNHSEEHIVQDERWAFIGWNRASMHIVDTAVLYLPKIKICSVQEYILVWTGQWIEQSNTKGGRGGDCQHNNLIPVITHNEFNIQSA